MLLVSSAALAVGACSGHNNQPPSLGSPEVATDEDAPVGIQILDSASDPEGDPLTVTGASAPGHGVEVVGGSSIMVTPMPNFHGTIDVAYQVSDGSNVVTGHAIVTVRAVNDPPTAADRSQQIHGPAVVMLAGSDIDGDALTYEIVTAPSHGTLTGTAPALQYAPEAGFVGDDAIAYRVHDAALASEPATLHLQLGPGASPVAASEAVVVTEDIAHDVTLHGSDPEGNSLTFVIAAPPAHGTLDGAAPNLVYTPAQNFNGADTLTFSVSNGYSASAAATITITVTPVNDAPVAIAQSIQAVEDTSMPITLAGSDIEGSALTFQIQRPPAHGTVSGSGVNRTYTPAPNYHGPDSFDVVALDGVLASAPATVTIDVASVEDPPVAAVLSLSLSEDTSAAVMLAGDDGDGDPIGFAIATTPAHGTLSGTAPALTYTPAADFNGADSFTYTASSGGATSASATVTIQVAAVNDAPIAPSVTVTTPEDTPITIAPLASDVDGGLLTFTTITFPVDGTLSGTGASRTYTPSLNTTGSRSFTFRVSDGQVTATATVTIVITPVNDPPVAIHDFAATDVNTPLTFNVVGNDTDVDGDVLALDSVVAPVHGSVEIVGGQFVYTPETDFTGVELVTYTIVDGHGGSATSHVHVGTGTFPPGAPTETVAAVGGVSSFLPQNAPVISGDGRIIAMVTTAALVAGDTNNRSDIYVFDRGTRVFARVSVASNGGQANGTSQHPSVSADGRYVVFESDSTNLVPGDTNSRFDVFRHDRVTGETVRVSVASGGGQGSGHSASGTISDDGNLVAFASDAFTLVANDANGATDIFVRDVAAGTTTRVSVTATGGEADLASTGPTISGDGRIVSFSSPATNLVAGDTNNVSDVFLRDLVAGTTTRVSVSSTGVEGNRLSGSASLSHDGRFVSFLSSATNLVPNATSSDQLFVRDTQAQTTTFTLEAFVGSPGQMSGDGRYIAAKGFNAVFVRDRFGAVTVRPTGATSWLWPALSGDGRYMVVLETTGGGLIVMLNPL